MPSAALLPKVSLVYSIGDQTKEAVCIYVWKPIEKAQMCGHEKRGKLRKEKGESYMTREPRDLNAIVGEDGDQLGDGNVV